MSWVITLSCQKYIFDVIQGAQTLNFPSSIYDWLWQITPLSLRAQATCRWQFWASTKFLSQWLVALLDTPSGSLVKFVLKMILIFKIDLSISQKYQSPSKWYFRLYTKFLFSECTTLERRYCRPSVYKII